MHRTLISLLAAALFCGCEIQMQTSSDGEPVRKVDIQLKPTGGTGGDSGQSRSGEEATATPSSTSASNAIRIATFNIQVLGTTKASKTDVMDHLGLIIRQFDVVAIQELRTKEARVMESLAAAANSKGAKYDYLVGPRLGRSSSKEQYVFMYDTERIQLESGSVYTISDPDDLLHREPLVATFRVRGPPTKEAFRFTLINIHTDPDETDTELDALGDVFRLVQSDNYDDDVILLGDVNVSEKKLGRLGDVPGITWIVHGEPTNTRRTKSYDNILFTQAETSEFTGAWGIVDLQKQLSLSSDQALAISDHLPVWAEFTPNEAVRRVAARPGDSR
ncbi:MAG: endonuclease/exonuclease/phosphatase family protein [Pirellulaceae bacterium]|jgi:endonuclease/exonuclease/phosphatase family metal-dependent hydrolase|nr:endonuclease/exonuclease/phosphatase family protein [Pirellulaceae bacterium]MDP7019122.1 endonuclease/exonuclease/phosphatase family protein [Pirellulaceae bacterium]